MHTPDFVLTLAAGLGAALAFGYATHRLGLSPIVGYLLAGVAVGSHTPGFVADQHLADNMAEVGVILLMFGVGLHFHVEELLAVRRVAVPGAAVQCAAATALGAGVALAFGWDTSAAVVFGLSVSIASTVVLTRVLADRNELHTPVGHVAVGWLILQDVFAVLVLVVMPAVFAGSRDPAALPLPLALGLALVKVLVLIAAVLVVGGRAVPWLLQHVAATKSRELFTLTVLVVALGVAVGSAMLFGASMALGAFLAGMVVGRSDFSVRAANEALPMRDAFAVLFFISVGMLFDPAYLLKAPGLVAATAAVVVLGTPAVAFAVVLARGYPVRVALGVGLALGQIGEFSFIVAATGASLKVLPDEATQVLVAVAIGTISVSPLVCRLAGPLERWARGRPRLWARLTARTREHLGDGPAPAPADVGPAYRAVVVGYGPVGRTVCRLLRENGIEPTVVEMNVETVKRLRAEGVRAVYGDATHPDTLKEAGVDGAASLILSSSQVTGGEEAIRAARELNPGVRVLARSAYVRELSALQQAGSEVVVSGEGEVALALTEAILRRLGATPDQIDRERERVRQELSKDGAEVYSRQADASPETLLPEPDRKG